MKYRWAHYIFTVCVCVCVRVCVIKLAAFVQALKDCPDSFLLNANVALYTGWIWRLNPTGWGWKILGFLLIPAGSMKVHRNIADGRPVNRIRTQKLACIMTLEDSSTIHTATSLLLLINTFARNPLVRTHSKWLLNTDSLSFKFS